MTKKIIRDTSDTRKLKMKLNAIKLGMILFLLSILSFTIGLLFVPTHLENYFGDFSHYTMISAFVIIFLVGIFNFSESLQKQNKRYKKKLSIIGPALMVIGVLLYHFTITTGLISALFGILFCLAGFIIIVWQNSFNSKKHQKH